MKGRTCIILGVVGLLLGVLVILLGCFAIPYELPRQKTDYLVIDSEKSAQYKDWAGGYDTKTEYQMVFTFFNLTNPDEVRTVAATPNYTIAGPYIYRRYRQAQQVKFMENGTKVQFLDFRDYVYDQTASQGRSKLDYISNVNPVYFSALAQAGGEQHMLVAASGGYYENFTNYFTGPFVSLYTSFIIPNHLPDAVNEKVAAINASNPDGDAMAVFLDVFCNYTSDYSVGGSWAGMLLSTHFNTSTNISSFSAHALLDPTITYSLVNSDPISAWAWDRAINSTQYSELISAALNLTQYQIEAIWHWRLESFGPAKMYDAVKEKYQLDTINDIGWVQWTLGLDVLGGNANAPVSINDTFPIYEIGYYMPIELWEASVYSGTYFPSWNFSKQVMNTTSGLGNMTVFQNLVLGLSSGAITDFSPWGLTSDQAQLFYGYAVGIGGLQVATALQNVYGSSGGLILNQTIDDWIFNCNPFLSNLLLYDPPSCNLLTNHSVFANVTIYTGKGNISRINEFIEWQGSPVVSGIWAKDIPVAGCTELGQFAPNQKKGSELYTFNDEFVRTMPLKYSTTSKVKGLNTYQYVVDYDSIFSNNDLYFQTIPGFTNMTSVKQAPVYYSLWDMLYVNESLKNNTNIVGVSQNLTENDCNTVLDVEPITGNTVSAYKRLQANVYSPPNCGWCNAGFSPFGNEDARLKVGALKYAPRVGLIAGIVLGGLLVVAGIAMILYGRARKNDKYTPID